MSEGHQRRRVYILLTLTLVLSAASVSTAAAATTDTIWPHTTTPAVAAWPDNGSVELGVKVTPAVDGTITGVSFYKGATNTGTHTGHLWGSTGAPLATATFTGETASGWQTALFPAPVAVTAGNTYTASYLAPSGNYAYDSPTQPGGLSNQVTNSAGDLTATGGVYVYTPTGGWPTTSSGGGNYWVDVAFTPAGTVPPPVPRPGVTGAGSVLVLTDPTDPFTDDICTALLATKGIACARTDTGNITSASQLAPYRTVITAGAPLTSAQVTLVTNWVTSGGNLIAMRPAANLNQLLGIGAATGTLTDGYLTVDTTQSPGMGLFSSPMQFHSTADVHPLAGARAVATIGATPSAPTTGPAVTTRTLGAGTASAWLFDLARSNAFTRFGNPALAGQITTSALATYAPLPRVMDRFGNGYLDTSLVSVPQADIQVTLLGNQIEQRKYPVPVKWNFPAYKPDTHPGGFLRAAFVLTGDDHAYNSATLARFATEAAAVPGCSTVDWTCITSTSYAFAGAFSDLAAKPYTDKGFEVAPHIADSNQCATNWSTRAQLDDTIATPAINAWAASFPTIAAAHRPVTQRFHCYGGFMDYASIPKIEKAHGMTADTSSSCWPPQFVTGVCQFTGSGFPQQYADSDGTLTGTYQYTTQATDENPGTVTPAALDGLIKAATGPSQFFTYATVLAHLDNGGDSNQAEADVRAAAAANDVPVISAAQAQAFTAGREATKIGAPAYGTSTVSFTVSSPVRNLLLMQPVTYGAKTLSTVKRGTTAVPVTAQTIGGVTYGVFRAAAAGTYTVTYQ